MRQDLLDTYKNLFLVYPAGCGGNHLANMISLTPGFTPRKVCQNYMLEMYEEYAHTEGLISFHFSDLQNLQQNALDLYIDRYLNSSQRNIWVSHFTEYIYTNSVRNKPIRNLPNKIFCLFTSPKVGSLPFKRMYFGPWSGEKEFEPPQYYTPEVFCNFNRHSSEKVDPERVFVMDTERFFLSYDYLSTTLYENLKIELPEICRLLHHLWLEGVYQYIARFEVDNNEEYVYNIRHI